MNGIFEKIKGRRMNQVQFIALGFLLIIIAGACILTLPVASRTREWTGFFDALFTSTSATCVTGLVVVDTCTHWSLFGQLVILVLIQVGGLGFVTIAVGFSLLFGRRIGLRERDLLKESVNAMEIGGIVKLARKIFIGTAICEGAGAVVLSFRFVPRFGVLKGIYYGVFHSISAFCNAGFDLMGRGNEYASLTSWVQDVPVNITMFALIIIGGLGFTVWNDLWKKKWHFKRYALHTKIVLSVTLLLVAGGAVLLYIFERNNTLAGMDGKTQVLASIFGSVTARTAGFNTVDTGALTQQSKLLTILLMFIGGSPGSTAGGVKTTTVAVLLIYVFASLRGNSGTNVFHRRVSDEIIHKASMVFILNLAMGLIGAVVILSTSGLAMDDVLFEVYSAISTVGMSTGITRDLNTVGRVVIIVLMYCGRVGSMTFALSLFAKRESAQTMLPVENITIG
ncbi:MAG: TrkH family potassium uptake protein [Clostridiales bacterium]|nr:TrkH family potassium uptake protein [Clostridiales bacterium]